MRRVIVTGAVLALAALVAGPTRSQDQGNAPNFRNGAVWQTEIDLAKEAVRELQAEVDAMDLDEWKDRSVAWIEITPTAESDEEYLAVPASWHVGGLDAGRKVEVELESEYDPQPKWQLHYGKKQPRTLTLVLTDDEGTRVDCSLSDLMKQGDGGYLGVFVHTESATIHCIPRNAG